MLWLAYLLIFLYGLAHTPLLVDLLRHFFPHWNIQRLTSNTASVILVLLVLLVYLLSLGMQLFLFIPLMPPVPHWYLKVILHSLFAYWVWVNAVTNYLYVLLSKPGIFRSGHNSSSSEATPKVDVSSKFTESSSLRGGLDKGESHSERSEPEENETVQKSPRHHCKICQATILYRDHHCPFTGNCIGLHNYSYFFLGLFYSLVGLAYGITVFFVYFGQCFFLAWKAVGIGSDHSPETEDEFCKILEPYGEIMLPSIGALVTVALMLAFQVFMLMTNVSTYEVLKRWRQIKVDFGGFRKEGSRFRVMLLEQRTHLLWFLLPVRNKI